MKVPTMQRFQHSRYTIQYVNATWILNARCSIYISTYVYIDINVCVAHHLCNLSICFTFLAGWHAIHVCTDI